MKSIVGVKNLKAKLAERVFVTPSLIPLGPLSGTDSRVVHANSMTSPARNGRVPIR
jgi:hypothetical protein